MVQGFCSPDFENVREEFVRNFVDRGEIGAALAIYLDGELAVDLWGGVVDTDTSAPWGEDTMAVAFSATKGLSALCMHMLIDRGLVSLDAPVTRYWPAFGQNGKDAITVAMVLAHQAGLPVFHEPLPDAGLTDWPLVISRLENEVLAWEPDPAASDDCDCFTRPDVRGVDHRAHAGNDRTANERGAVERHVLADGHASMLMNQHLLGK
jgi:CubicO group peptidase (beta-lactamase class C family)